MDAVTQKIRVLAVLNHTPGGHEHDQQKHAGDDRYSSQGIVGHFQGKPIRKGTYGMSHAKAVEEVKRVAPLMDKIAKAWKRVILKHDPKAKIEIRGTKDYLDRANFFEAGEPDAWIELHGKTSKGETFGIGLSLYPAADGNIIKMNDSDLPKSLQKKGIFSAGVEIATRPEFNLSGKFSVHHSSNDRAWQRIADKYGFSWKEWQEGGWIDVPDKDLYLFQNSVIVNHTPGGHEHDQDKHGNDKSSDSGSSLPRNAGHFTDVDFRSVIEELSNGWEPVDLYTRGIIPAGEMFKQIKKDDGYDYYVQRLQDELSKIAVDGYVVVYRGGWASEKVSNGTLDIEKARHYASGHTGYDVGKIQVYQVPVENFTGVGSTGEQEVFFKITKKVKLQEIDNRAILNTALLIRINAVLRGLHNHKGPGDHPSGSSQEVHGGDGSISVSPQKLIEGARNEYFATEEGSREEREWEQANDDIAYYSREYHNNNTPENLQYLVDASQGTPVRRKAALYTMEKLKWNADGTITLYRGGTDTGQSWSTDRAWAERFAIYGFGIEDRSKNTAPATIHERKFSIEDLIVALPWEGEVIVNTNAFVKNAIRMHAVLNRTALALRLPTVITNHLPGKHDQKKHGYKQTLFRGKSKKPSDPGDLGIGEYYTTSESMARQYGELSSGEVSSRNLYATCHLCPPLQS